MSKLYKYQSTEDHHFNSLRDHKIWAATYESLNDVKDLMSYRTKIERGRLPDDLPIYNLVSDEEYKKLTSYNPYHQIQVEHYKNIGIYSLCKNPINVLMWAHYANGYKGFVIEFNKDRLIQDISQDLMCPSEDILYFENPPSIYGQSEDSKKLDKDDKNDPGTAMSIRKKRVYYFTKSKDWEYEDEVRMIFKKSGLKDISPPSITGIYFGAKMSTNHKKRIINNLQNFTHIEYYQIMAQRNSYEFIKEKLTSDDIKGILMTETNTENNFQTLKPMIVSYWTDMIEVLTIERSSNFYVFIGTFKRDEEKAIRRIGVCYEGYPSSRGKITPLMMPHEASLIFLNGLLMDAIQKNNTTVITSITDAINIIKTEG